MHNYDDPFYFDINFSFANESMFNEIDNDATGFIPPVSGEFLLLDGAQFLLLSGEDFSLL